MSQVQTSNKNVGWVFYGLKIEIKHVTVPVRAEVSSLSADTVKNLAKSILLHVGKYSIATFEFCYIAVITTFGFRKSTFDKMSDHHKIKTHSVLLRFQFH